MATNRSNISLGIAPTAVVVILAIAAVMIAVMATQGTVTTIFANHPGPASGNGIVPVFTAGNPTCGDLSGGSLTEFKIEPVTSGVHSDGTLTLTIVRTDTNDGPHFDWSSNIPVELIFVKGGPDGNLYTYGPPATSDTFLHSPVNHNNDKFYDLSHISFCYEVTTPSPTPTPPVTATPTPPVTVTPTPPVTATPTPPVTATPTPPVTATPTPPVTATPTPPVTATPTPPVTATPTPPVTATPTPTVPSTDTPSPSPTVLLETQTPAPTDTPAPTPTPTATPTGSPTASPTALGETATPGVLPPTGGGPAGFNASVTWLIALLAVTGLLLAGGMGLAAARIRND